MYGIRLFALAAATVALGCTFAAQAGTITGGSAQPATAALSAASPQGLVKYTFQIHYFNQEKPACGARLDYGDGRPAEMLPIQNPTASVARDVAYTTPGAYKMTLSGSAFGGMVACLGSTTVSASVIKSVPIGAIAGNLGAGTLQPVPGQNPGGAAPATGKSIADLNLGGVGPLQPVGGQPQGGAAQGGGTTISNLNLGGAGTLQPVGGPPEPHDGVNLGFSMDAPIFTYGVKQGFKLKQDSSGGICHFSMRVMSDHVISNQDFAVTLPWTSPDLKLPALPAGKSYTVRLTALSNPLGHYTGNNGCWGEYDSSFQVVQMGKLSSITASALTVATGQTVEFNVLGENYGGCQYSFVVGPRYRPRPPAQTISYLPYQHMTSFPAAGDFFASADEIDVNGVALGCTGQIASNTVKVIDRPACPSPQYAYKNDNDSEYGCKFPASVQAAITESYSCPTGYASFKTPGAQMQYGCRRSAALGETIGQASGAAPNDTPDKPTLKKIQLVAVSGGGIPRPNSNIVYAGEALRLDISGNLPNNAGYGNQCGYTVALENVATHVSKDFNFDTFDIHAFGAAPIAGEYSVKATPHAHGNVPGCLGQATATITLHPAAAWLTGLKLTGFGAHFGAVDDGLYPEFCENCDSIFSPAHNSALMDTAPSFASGPSCGYEIVQNGKSTPMVYASGSAVPPAYPATRVQPWRSKWSSKSTVTVTVKGFAGLPPLPACNGSITKTVTWTDDPNLPPVVVQ